MSHSNINKFSLIALLAFSTVLLFQNCAPASFGQTVKVVDAACENADGCVSAGTISVEEEASTRPPAEAPSVVQNPAPVPQSTPAPAPVLSEPVLYNVVTGYKADCDRIVQGYGAPVSCTVGGGCGISCGMPGPSCPSANPGLWGACFHRSSD